MRSDKVAVIYSISILLIIFLVIISGCSFHSPFDVKVFEIENNDGGDVSSDTTDTTDNTIEVEVTAPPGVSPTPAPTTTSVISTPTPTQMETPIATHGVTFTPFLIPSPSVTMVITPTPTGTPEGNTIVIDDPELSPTPTVTSLPSTPAATSTPIIVTPTSTVIFTPIQTAIPTTTPMIIEPSPMPTITPVQTVSATPSSTPIITPVQTVSATPSITAMPSPVQTVSATPSITAMPSPVYGNLAFGADYITSSYDNTSMRGVRAFDGDDATYWRSGDVPGDEWILVDLDGFYRVHTVILRWLVNKSCNYKIQIYDENDQLWIDIIFKNDGNTLVDTHYMNSVTRYVRVMGLGTLKNPTYSLCEFEVYGEVVTMPTPVPVTTPVPGEVGNWCSSIRYSNGDRVIYDDSVWVCVFRHISIDIWYPGAPGVWFWRKVNPGDG